MALAELLAPDAPVRIHADRMVYWDAAFDDVRLKRSIFLDPGMFPRIFQDLFNEELYPPSIAENAISLADRLTQCSSEDELHNIGLGWCAPLLFPYLFSKETRLACGPLSPDQIDMVRSFREHSAPQEIGHLPREDEIKAEGRQCLLAWLVEQTTPETNMLIQRFSPQEELSVTHPALRARYFDHFLAYRNL